ncbi:hypothetical protein V5O48_009164 [Marasmius crinis-equi]|uniref:Uncharacterized protein n=1 Tax=Marasmius crinis-equi TaxID=585013 RepID=A0ABR3FBY7_9AGAR
MFSLRKLFVAFVAATVAVSAAPAPTSNRNAATIFNPRCECFTNPLPVIVSDCTAKITPLVGKLQSLKGNDCTAGNIKPIVQEIKVFLTEGIQQVNVLLSSSVDSKVKLSDASGAVISVSDCGKLIAGLVILIFGCMSTVLKVVVSGQSSEVIALFADLGVSTENGGILSAVLPLIKGSLGVCVTLGITSSFDFLGFDFGSLTTTVVTAVTSATPTTVTTLAVSATTAAAKAVSTAPTSIVVILKECNSKILPLVNQLKSLSSQDCTSGKISPITAQIKSVLSVCVTQIGALAGKGKEVVFASDNGTTISITDCAYLCGDIAACILTGLLKVIVTTRNQSEIASVCVDVCGSVAVFLKSCCDVITFDGGLVVALIPVIKSSLGVCIKLGATDAFGFLGIDFGKLAVELGITVGGAVVATATTSVLASATSTSVASGSAGSSTSGTVTVSVVTIFKECSSKLGPLVDKLANLGAKDCTSQNVKAIVDEIKGVIVATKGRVSGLAGLGVEVVLAGNGGVAISIDECAKLCGQIVIGIFTACSAVLKVVVAAELRDVKLICVDLCICVGDFLKTCCGVVTFNGGLTAALVPVIKGSLSICVDLGVTDSFGFLGIDFGHLGGAVGGAVLVSLPQIIADVSGKIQPLVGQLKALKANDCTSENVGNLIGQIKEIIVDATVKVKLLANADISVVLAGANGGAVIGVDACVKMVADLCNSIFGCIDFIIGIVGVGHARVVFGLCADLGICTGIFIKACGGCVGGLYASLIPLMTASFRVCVKLAITNSFGFIGVDFGKIAASAGLSLNGLLTTVLGGGLKLGGGLNFGLGIRL